MLTTQRSNKFPIPASGVGHEHAFFFVLDASTLSLRLWWANTRTRPYMLTTMAAQHPRHVGNLAAVHFPDRAGLQMGSSGICGSGGVEGAHLRVYARCLLFVIQNMICYRCAMHEQSGHSLQPQDQANGRKFTVLHGESNTSQASPRMDGSLQCHMHVLHLQFFERSPASGQHSSTTLCQKHQNPELSDIHIHPAPYPEKRPLCTDHILAMYAIPYDP